MYFVGLLRFWKIIGFCAVLLCMLSVSIQAESFVSYNGRFHFSYPDSWTQLDYTTAEFYLTRGDTTQQVDFEAVFCEDNASLLFHDQYLILTVDTIGKLDARQIDSVADRLGREFNRPIKEVPTGDFLASFDRTSVIYDRVGSRFAVESEVPGDSTGSKINLLVMQVYEHGIANYYFYSPTTDYSQNLPVYRDMIASFSTEPLEPTSAAVPVKVADIETESETTRNYPLFFGPPLAVILIILIVRLRKRRQQTTSAENRKG